MKREESSEENFTDLYYNPPSEGEIIYSNLIKWKCTKCRFVNVVEAQNQLVEVVDGNISGLGKCFGKCKDMLELPDNEEEMLKLLGRKKKRDEEKSEKKEESEKSEKKEESEKSEKSSLELNEEDINNLVNEYLSDNNSH